MNFSLQIGKNEVLVMLPLTGEHCKGEKYSLLVNGEACQRDRHSDSIKAFQFKIPFRNRAQENEMIGSDAVRDKSG